MSSQEIETCGDEAALRNWNSKYFGKQGELTLAMKKVGEVPPAERRSYGQEANRVKESLSKTLEQRLQLLVSPQVEVFAILALQPLEIERQAPELLVLGSPIALAHGHAFLLELRLQRFDLSLTLLQFLRE